MVAVVAAVGVSGPVSATPAGTAVRNAAVIAFVGESGVNVLSDDFRSPGGRTPAYPAALGPIADVTLPNAGTFAQRVAAVRRGVLGHLTPGRIYAIRGTRLLVVSAPGSDPQRDVTGGGTTTITVGAPDDPMLHGTGVVDSAIGSRYGTAPGAVGLIVLGNDQDSWDWLVGHRGVDVVTMSAYEVSSRATGCATAADVRTFVRRGGMVFSSSGNTTDETEPVAAPNGMPEVYQVGGVHDDGEPWGLPPSADSNPFYAAGQVTRPYQTGELYDFTTAGYDGTATTMRFGGTSGATPRTAGRAAELLMTARSLLAHGKPSRGPLADGRVAAADIEQLLRHVAIAYYPSQHPAAFAIEGYGYLNDLAQSRAVSVLRGTINEPNRSQDDQVEAGVEQVRAAAFTGC